MTSQDVASRPGSEPDTVVEPDVAVNPNDRDNAIATAHDSRYPDGGAVGISAAWTRDGGATWQHKTVPGITVATGGPYERASDPVPAFGRDGTAYLSVLLFNASNCDTAVAVLRSVDGGANWGAPSYAHRSNTCDYSDDKNWLVVDTTPTSPHYQRVYQFWTPFLSKGNTFLGAPQAVRWSDDRARTWSATSYLTALNHDTQNSQPMIKKDGTIVDTFYDFGIGGVRPDAVPGASPDNSSLARRARAALIPATTINATGTIFAATSSNGAQSWSPQVEVANNAEGFAVGVRCCLFAADIDRSTGRMFVAFEGGVANTDPVYAAWSDDGRQWSAPVRVSRGDVSGVQRVNVDVVASGSSTYVTYGTRTDAANAGGVVQQQLSVSPDAGRSYGPPMSIGPLSVLKYAAQSRGYFPGDYIGAAIAPGRLYLVWARSSKPPAASTSRFHQVIYGATLRP